jgi:hypothetical protein
VWGAQLDAQWCAFRTSGRSLLSYLASLLVRRVIITYCNKLKLMALLWPWVARCSRGVSWKSGKWFKNYAWGSHERVACETRFSGLREFFDKYVHGKHDQLLFDMVIDTCLSIYDNLCTYAGNFRILTLVHIWIVVLVGLRRLRFVVYGSSFKVQ